MTIASRYGVIDEHFLSFDSRGRVMEGDGFSGLMNDVIGKHGYSVHSVNGDNFGGSVMAYIVLNTPSGAMDRIVIDAKNIGGNPNVVISGNDTVKPIIDKLADEIVVEPDALGI